MIDFVLNYLIEICKFYIDEVIIVSVYRFLHRMKFLLVGFLRYD